MAWLGRSNAGSAAPIVALKASLTAIARALRFLSRLPVPRLPWEEDPHGEFDLTSIVPVFPVAGALVACWGAGALLLALLLGFGPWLSAALAVASLVLVTGALHEDGLADTADGFAGGSTPERRLAIMRDSRIGAFGGSALSLSVLLRSAALGTLASRLDPIAAAGAVVIAGTLSRTAALTPMVRLPPARSAGLGFEAGRPSDSAHRWAWVLAGLIGISLGWLVALPLVGIAVALALTVAAAFGLTRLSARLIGGHTGDVAGATQQLCELAAMLGLLIAVPL